MLTLRRRSARAVRNPGEAVRAVLWERTWDGTVLDVLRQAGAPLAPLEVAPRGLDPSSGAVLAAG